MDTKLGSWVHRIANILNHLPKCLQPSEKRKLHDMMQADGKSDADIVKKKFSDDYGDKYPKAVKCFDNH